jgi:hypothetical protein
MQCYCLYHYDYLHNDKSHVHFLFIRITTMTKSNITTYTILYYSHGQKKRHPPKIRVFYKYHFNDHEFSNYFAVGVV